MAQMTVISKGWKRRVCSLLAQSRHHRCADECPLLGVKQTLRRVVAMSAFGTKRTFVIASAMSAFGPKRTLARQAAPEGADWFSEPNWVTSRTLEVEDVFRLQTVIRLCRTFQHTAPLAPQPCARQFFGNCPTRVDNRFYRGHPCTDKSRRCDSHSTLEGLTELGRQVERRSPRSESNTS